MTENSFAFRLKELLEHQKLTLQAVATVLGISRTAVHKWTRGGEIDYDNLRMLATFLKVNWIWLRYGDEALQDAQHVEVQDLPMTDVRRKYTAQIMESEARMKLAQESAGIVNWEWNLITDEVSYSANVEAVYGWPVRRNEDFWCHLHPDDVTALQAIYRDCVAEGKGYEFDFRIFHPNGEQRWITSRATSLQDSSGRSVKMVGVSLDSTERKRVEDELRQSEERFRAIFELAGGALAYIGLDGKWQRVNQPLCELLGYSAEELADLTFQELTHPEDLSANLAQVQRLLDGQETVSTMEKRFRRKDGSYIWVKVRTSVQRNPRDGSPEHMISVYDDITALRAEHQALTARIAELEQRLGLVKAPCGGDFKR
ncbi:helix-turn-helix transcriptional regulator [Pseudomonas sp. BN411]|uniref:helix-turn-helix domain-containing protein n=1 Tax=Pseudomonas sp. BN411 TaxID=2567887 RepID=UPI002453A082|nr:helix-turn-helix transcriptional regulator [Pseudomonas sp. BN411]MDH4563774.1 PAS domain S-box protein [Pseudomonas sp. BN411]